MAVKTYSLKKHGKQFCSAHTQVREMACKDGTDKILIDENLMIAIEKLFSALKCSIYVITSGYRTSKHDKGVGGNGRGYHTKGMAIDARFYDKNNKVISTKEISCIAQDLGLFRGIANIDKSYTEIHLDTRENGTYKGNEIYGTNSVTTDFYDYYNIDRSALRAKYGLTTDTKISATYQVWDDKKNKWLPNVVDNENFAGNLKNPICALYVSLTKGNVYYRVHTRGGKWLPEVKNRNDYAGIYNTPIDAISMRTDTGKILSYQVHTIGGKWLPYVTGCNINDGLNGYAGSFGKQIDGIRIYIK